MIKTDQLESDAMAKQHQLESISMTETEYLKSELTSEFKREYIKGQVYAMAGAGHNHNCISANIGRKFGNQLEGTPCVAFVANMKVKAGENYFYPDVVVDCGKMQGDTYFLTSPVIIVEALSSETRKIDTTEKLKQYIKLPSFQEYVLVEQDIVAIQVLRKEKWGPPAYYFLGDSVTFESIGLTLTVEEIYDRVDNADMNEFRQLILLPQE
jgi:Uma2 family endonuclease